MGSRYFWIPPIHNFDRSLIHSTKVVILTLTYVYVCINVLQLQASFLLYTLLSRYHLLKLTTVHIRICIKTRQYLTSCSNPCLLHTILYVQDLLTLSMYYYCVYWYVYTYCNFLKRNRIPQVQFTLHILLEGSIYVPTYIHMH